MIYRIFSKLVRCLFKSRIVAKPIKGYAKLLYYETAQHLTFFFQREIEYEAIIFNNIKNYIPIGTTVLDIGGNIGQYALRFSESVGFSGKVITCEPDFKNYSFLQFNVNINHCKNVLVLNIGAGEKQDKKIFYRDTVTGGRTSSFKKEYVRNNYKGNESEVDIVTYQQLSVQYGVPGFVKIDVEGFETEVVKGIQDFSHPTVFLIEVRKQTSKEIFEIFEKNGFNCFVVDDEVPIKIIKSEDIPVFANLLFSK